jgi:hypothetical protein
MKPSQIQLRLFEDSGCQILSARLLLVVFGSVHAVLIWFVTYFLSVSKIDISEIRDFLRDPSAPLLLLSPDWVVERS